MIKVLQRQLSAFNSQLSVKDFLIRLLPFLQWLPLVNRKTLQQDFVAGITGAVVVLPQGVAFATIAGLPPQYGLYTAMVTPIIAALFGSSRHLVSGPTTAMPRLDSSSMPADERFASRGIGACAWVTSGMPLVSTLGTKLDQLVDSAGKSGKA